MRILLGYFEIAGYYLQLSRGLRSLGVKADFICLQPHDFAYGQDDSPSWLQKCVIRLRALDARLTRRQLLAKLFWRGVYLLPATLLLLVWIFRYDVFILGYHSQLLFHWELPLLKALGKRVIYIYHGSDARPPYLDGSFSFRLNGAQLAVEAARQRRLIARIEKYADLIINHPPQGHFFTRPFVVSYRLGLPYQLPAQALAQLQNPEPESEHMPEYGLEHDPKQRVRVLHSPSNPQAKGSDIIRAVIARLQARGYAIDWVELIGRPNSEVLAELARCDFIVDQLYADTPMAGFATEAAFFGKAAVVAGYYQEIKNEIPGELLPPSYYCWPEDLEKTLEHVLNSPQERDRIGSDARDFVRSHWTATQVARRMLDLIEHGPPADWLFDPMQIHYLYGCGLPESRLIEGLRELLAAAGPAGLQLNDKPALRQALIDLAGRATGEPAQPAC